MNNPLSDCIVCLIDCMPLIDLYGGDLPLCLEMLCTKYDILISCQAWSQSEILLPVLLCL